MAPNTCLRLTLPLPLDDGGRGEELAVAVEGWRTGDIARAADLLRAAYPADLARYFTEHGTAVEWRTYVTALVMLGPCGAFQRDWSRVIREDGALVGVALMTAVAPSTAHLAQLAVRPDLRRRGIGGRLVRDAAAAAAAAGCRELTLLVAHANRPARRLYESLGFIQLAA